MSSAITGKRHSQLAALMARPVSATMHVEIRDRIEGAHVATSSSVRFDVTVGSPPSIGSLAKYRHYTQNPHFQVNEC